MRVDLCRMAAGALALTLPLGSAFAGAGAGALTQLSGTDACVSWDGSGGDCAEAVGLGGLRGVAASPDGKNVYTAAQFNEAGGVSVFARDRRTGALRQLSGTDACVARDGNGGICATGIGLEGVTDVVVSQDGRNVYTVATFRSKVAAFARDRRTGALRQLAGTDACVGGTGCSPGVAMPIPVDIAVSRDGRNAYVGTDVGGVGVLARNRRTGALRQLAGTDACVSWDGSGGDCAIGLGVMDAGGVAVSPDGKNVYTAAKSSHAVAAFARDRTTGALRQLAGTDACISNSGSDGDCVDGVALSGAMRVAVSPDGRNVYVASAGAGAVAAFARDRRTGALRQLAGTDACVSNNGNGGNCVDGVALGVPRNLAVSADGKHVYVVSSSSHSVAVFARDRNTGALRQLADTDACASDDGTNGDCIDGVALNGPHGIAVSRDGKSVYVASQLSHAVAVFARARGGRH